MEKREVVTLIIIILIIVSAIFVGVKLGKKDSSKTSNNPVNENTYAPVTNATEDVNKSPSPEETTEPTALPSSIPQEDVSNYTVQQKEAYAKKIAQQIWQGKGLSTNVYYSLDNISGDGKYVISVRDHATTEALIWYEIDIYNHTCNEL